MYTKEEITQLLALLLEKNWYLDGNRTGLIVAGMDAYGALRVRLDTEHEDRLLSFPVQEVDRAACEKEYGSYY